MLSAVYIKGFKTFARPTRMPLEGGITAVVGPNGSGKSNVTDAVLFALGEQRPAVLRAGSMGDLIFSGSDTLQGSRVAEVTLVFDNASGAISLPYGEVSVTRRISRDGDSQYRINGSRSRLTDVRSVAGEMGIGRHSILRQGAVDDIVSGGAAACRSALEEAAGLGVYRRRRISASRRLERADAQLEKSRQLESELSGQLRRIEAEAEAAREYRELESRYRKLSLAHLYRVATRGLDDLRHELEQSETRQGELSRQEEALREQQAAIEARERTFEGREREIDGLLEAAEAGMESLQAGALRTERALFRLEGARSRQEESLQRTGRLEEEHRSTSEKLERLEAKLGRVAERQAAEKEGLQARERELSDRRSEHGEAQGRSARLRKELEALRSRAGQESPGAPEEPGEEDLERLASATGDLEALVRSDPPETPASLEEALEAHRRRIEDLHSGMNRRRGALDALTGETEARVRSLRAPANGSGGTRLYEVVRARPGFEGAVQAALGELASGVLAEDMTQAVELVSADEWVAVRLDAEDAGEPGFAPGKPLLECVEILDPALEPALKRLLTGIYVVEDSRPAAPANGWVAVTREGMRFTRISASRDAAPAGDGSFIRESRRHREERRLQDLEAGPAEELARLQRAVAAAAARSGELNAGVSALEDAAGQFSRAAHLIASEATRRLERARRDRDRILANQREAERAEAEASSTEAALREAEETRRRAEAALEAASGEVETARAAYGELNRRLEGLRSAVREGRSRLSTVSGELERLREVSTRDTSGLGRTASGAAELVNQLVAAARERRNRLRSSRAQVSSTRNEVSAERTALSRRDTELAGELATLRAEISQLQERLARSEQAAERAREEISEEWGADLETARREAEHLPDEKTSEAERNRLARNLKRFGDVNLLAISQRDQLAERLEFVASQRADAEEAATDLNHIIQDIDGEIESRFDGTFRRVRESFRDLVPRLMEGSAGELELSEEGVEIGLRLGRRGWRPLHVLSGGERALLALSFLFSVFLSRTQGATGAVCILDEAEATLDDLNLARFLAVVDFYRASGQFVLVTHQKRTMAAADVLYGVTQDASGATAVVSKRLAGD